MGIVCASTLRADYKQSYHEGYQLARQGRDWEIVALKMSEALKENDREGEQVVLTSANAQPYLPYFYLGLARFHLGDCRGARDNWVKSSVQKKVVLHGREREWFNEYSPICELAVPIEDAFKQTQTRLQSIDELARDADLGKVWSQEPAFAPALVKLRQQFDQAREGLKQARASKVELQQALLTSVKADATQLADQTETLLKTARGRRDDLAAARVANEKRLAEERKPATDSSIASAGNNAGNGGANGGGAGGGGVASSETKLTDSKASGSKTGDLKTGDLKAEGAKTGGPKALAPNVGGAKAVETRAIVPVSLTPPDALRAVAQDFVKGRYREAREGLQAQAVPNEWRAHAALLRAASAFSLYYAEGQKDRKLLDEATRAVQACAQANHDLRPSRRLFAPHFIEFFDRHAAQH
jgi:hypothetical protein